MAYYSIEPWDVSREFWPEEPKPPQSAEEKRAIIGQVIGQAAKAKKETGGLRMQ